MYSTEHLPAEACECQRARGHPAELRDPPSLLVFSPAGRCRPPKQPRANRCPGWGTPEGLQSHPRVLARGGPCTPCLAGTRAPARANGSLSSSCPWCPPVWGHAWGPPQLAAARAAPKPCAPRALAGPAATDALRCREVAEGRIRPGAFCPVSCLKHLLAASCWSNPPSPQ